MLYLAIFIALVSGLLLLLALLKSGTMYISGRSGFTAIRSTREKIHHVSEAEMLKVIASFLPGDLFDMVWISREEDEYGGILLLMDEGVPVLSLSFKTLGEREELNAFQAWAKGHLDFPLAEDSDGHNGGFGDEHRITTLDYSLPKSLAEIHAAIRGVLKYLQGEEKSGYFVSASLLSDGPGGRTGIKYSPSKDPLSQVL